MTQEGNRSILVTGASGFIGSHIVAHALSEGMEVWAAVRASSSGKYLQDPRIHILTLDLSDVTQMREALREVQFDYVVHAAGATKARHRRQFFEVNTDGTRNLVLALEVTQQHLRRFVFLSSLSVMGAIHETMPYKEMRDDDTPQPNTAYGASKLAAEEWLKTNTSLPWTILRPTGVYGPREKDYMLMVDSIRRGVDVAAGYQRQDITFIYYKDVVTAVMKSMQSDATVGRAYFLSDGAVYQSRTFSDLIMQQLGRRHVLRLKLPLWMLRAVCAASDLKTKLGGGLSTLNNDHYHVLAQRNWRCDISPARRDFGFDPQWPLDKGVADMLKKQGE